jgi:hypothetical protein
MSLLTEQEKAELIKSGVPTRFLDADILALGDEFTGVMPNTQLPDAKDLPEGEYIGEILETQMDVVKTTGEPILKLIIEIVSGPQTGLPHAVQVPHWMSKADSMARLAGDLAALGFPAHTWTPKHGKNLVLEVTRLHARRQIKGIPVSFKIKIGESTRGPRGYVNNLARVAPEIVQAKRAKKPAVTSFTAPSEDIPF